MANALLKSSKSEVVDFCDKSQTEELVMRLHSELSAVMKKSGLSPELQAHAALITASQAARRASIASFNAAALLFDYYLDQERINRAK